MSLLRSRRRRAVLMSLAVCAASVAGSAVAASPTVAAPPADPPVAAAEPAVDQAVFGDPSSGAVTLSRGSSSVTVSKTANLPRQMVDISWRGMTPSSLSQTFVNSVAIMQCRGHNPDRHDCWTGRSLDNNHPEGGDFGRYASFLFSPDDPSAFEGPAHPGNGLQWTWLPFRKADGSYLASRSGESATNFWRSAGLNLNNFPDYDPATWGFTAVDDFTPSTGNFRQGRTRADGTGEIQTWVNTGFENPSLGCSDEQSCSLVVVPINKAPCRTDLSEALAKLCVGQSNISAQQGGWRFMANWNQRFVFKQSFAPREASCAQRTGAAELAGSELVAVAMLRWAPARCQAASAYPLDYTVTSEPDARRLLGTRSVSGTSGYLADAALTTEPTAPDDPVTGTRKPAYAPAAVSGFAIGFTLDTNRGRQVSDLRLSPRLVAKLLTQSYPGRYATNAYGVPVNPNTAGNPSSLTKDPEFLALNPLKDPVDEFERYNSDDATQLVLPVAKSDVVLAMTRWLWSDPQARAFLLGKPDEWGMRVNTTYRGWSLPRDDYELNDGWLIPKSSGEGLKEGYPWMQLQAQTSSSWAQSADTLLSAWPRVQNVLPNPDQRPDGPALEPVVKRGEAQLPGLHLLFALSTVPDLVQAGMPVASLRNAAGEFTKPDVSGLHHGLDGATVDKVSGTWRIDYPGMDERGYPGTMISYAAVPTTGLGSKVAAGFADTIRWMSASAQNYGPEPGQLPDGYLSLPDPMRAQAARVAAEVERQSGTVPVPPDGEDPLPDDDDPTPDDPPASGGSGPGAGGSGPGSGNGTGTGTGTGTGGADRPGGSGTTGPTAVPSGPPVAPTPGVTPPAAQAKKPPVVASAPKPAAAATRGESLGWLSWGIPALLLAGLVAGVASPGIRILAEPGNPVRRGIVAAGTYLAQQARRGTRRARRRRD